MTTYLLYPEALEKIKQSGIAERVEKLKQSEEGLPYLGGSLLQSEIVDIVNELKEEGYYNNLPKDFEEKYKTTMNGILRNPEDHFWTIKRTRDTIQEPCALEELSIFMGDIASLILSPEEIWDYKKFGFDSPSAFVTTVSTYIIQQSRGSSSYKDGYKWTRKRNDGSEIVTEITGDINADLRVLQTDIAPYPTTDPFGNAIEMRPETSADRHAIAAYHSTEGSLFVAVMKYIEQQNIQSEHLKDEGKQLITWGKELGQGGGTCAEHLGGFDNHPMLFFAGYDFPIPQLSKLNETEKPTPFWIGTDFDGDYGAYIAHNGDLVFSFQNKNNAKEPRKPISARFLPEDADHLLKGLIYQSARGLGRTSANQLLDILKYRFSSEFEEDRKRYK